MVVYWTRSTILNIIVQLVLLLVCFISNLNPLHLVTISTPRIEKEIHPASSSILDLHEDVMFLILSKVDSYWVLIRARFVCKRWWNLCKDPCLLRVINVRHIPEYNYDRHLKPISYGTGDFYHRVMNHLESVTLLAVELSGGGLQKLCIQDFGRDEFLLLVSQSARFICKRWWNLCKDPCLLRVINVRHLPEYNYDRHLKPSSYGTGDFYHRAVNHLELGTLLAVELSGEGLQKLCIQDFGRDEFLLLVSQSGVLLDSARVSHLITQLLLEAIPKIQMSKFNYDVGMMKENVDPFEGINAVSERILNMMDTTKRINLQNILPRRPHTPLLFDVFNYDLSMMKENLSPNKKKVHVSKMATNKENVDPEDRISAQKLNTPQSGKRKLLNI
ncbi:hypothetical protein POM88_038629 [Heracleum sosnowskyi]|uniref:F-box protein n=1 Tax=Heracleum sosnowskyi TaxID=360622 RepID=A0AAD8HAR6_9APIA|nr:hypothetical protein POM88_038629 [Heracleum sosnowskyi]